MSRYAKRRETAMSELMDSALSAIDDLYAHAIRIETQSDKTPEVDWQPFSGHFFQRLRPAFLNSTGLM